MFHILQYHLICDLYLLNHYNNFYNDLDKRTGCVYSGIEIIYRENTDATENFYTSTKDGWIQGIAKTAKEIGLPFIRLEINNTTVFEGYGVKTMYSYMWSPLFEVKKGDIIKYTLSSNTNDSNKELRMYNHS